MKRLTPVENPPVTLSAMPEGYFWIASESIGSTDDEVGAMHRNEIDNERARELIEATQLAHATLCKASPAGYEWWMTGRRGMN